MNSVEIARKLTSIGECPHCGGIAFNYDIEVLILDCLSREDRERARKMVSEGADLNEIMGEFNMNHTEMTYWVCEKCEAADSNPKYTTM